MSKTATQKMSPEKALEIWKALVRCRKFEEKIVEVYGEQEMRCPTHLSIGQEAMASGVCAALELRDMVFSTHRCHSHTIAKGGDFKQMFSELYGKEAGCSHGKGGSMHFCQPEIGLMGASAIVGGTVPLAVGAALAAKMQGKDIVSVAFFGDGALEQGTFHEGMNLASLHKLPVLFVCENNDLATTTKLPIRQPYGELWKRAEGYRMPGVRVDGTRAEEVYFAAEEAVKLARSGGGPTFIEGPCGRWKEHVGPKTDWHLGFRTQEEVEAWYKKDPVAQFVQWSTEQKLIDRKTLDAVSETIQQEVNEAQLWSKNAPFPTAEAVFTDF